MRPPILHLRTNFVVITYFYDKKREAQYSLRARMAKEVERVNKKNIPIISFITDRADYNQEGWNQHGNKMINQYHVQQKIMQ